MQFSFQRSYINFDQMTLGQHHDTSSDHKQSLREVIDSYVTQ